MNDAKFEIEIDELEDVLEEELHLYENTSLEYAAEFLELPPLPTIQFCGTRYELELTEGLVPS